MRLAVPGAAAGAIGNARAVGKARVHLTTRASRICRAHPGDIIKTPLAAIRPPTERHNNARCEVLDLNHDRLGKCSNLVYDSLSGVGYRYGFGRNPGSWS
jgi:hypothetical protein